MGKTVGSFVAEFVANTEGLSAGFNRATDLSKGFSESIAAGVVKGQAIVEGLKVAFDGVTAALSAVTTKTADYGDKLNDARQRTGLTASELSKLKFEADQSGTSFEAVSSAVGKMSRNMDGHSEAFGRLGVSVNDAQGHLRSAGDVLGDVAEKFSHMEDGAQKSAIAQEIFGKSGADLIPLLNEGRDGLSAMGDQAERLGLVMSDKAAAAGDAFNDSLSSLEGATTGLSLSIGEALLPPLTVIVEAMTDVVVSIGDWVKANDPLIKSIVDLGQNIVVVMVDFVARAMVSVSDLIGVVGTVARALGLDGMAGALDKASDMGLTMAQGLTTVNNKMADSFYQTDRVDKATRSYTTTVGLSSAALKAQAAEAKAAAEAHKEMIVQIKGNPISAALYPADLTQASADFSANQRAILLGLKTGIADLKMAEVNALADVSAGLKSMADEYISSETIRTTASNAVAKIEKDNADAIATAHADAAEAMQQSFSTAMGNVTSGIAQGLADVIFHGGNFKDDMINVAEQTASGMLSSFLTGLLNPLTNALGKIGGNLAGLLTGKGGGGILSGVFGAGSGAAGSAAGGAGGGFGAVSSLLTNPWTIAVGAGIVGVTAWLKSQAHHEANQLVKDIENPFWNAWGQILPTDNADELAALDPDKAKSIFDNLTAMNENYLSLIDEFRKGGSDEEKVAAQSLSNTQHHVTDMLASLSKAMNKQSDLTASSSSSAVAAANKVSDGWSNELEDLSRAASFAIGPIRRLADSIADLAQSAMSGQRPSVATPGLPAARLAVPIDLPVVRTTVTAQAETRVYSSNAAAANVTINIQQQPGQSARELAMQIKSVLKANTAGLRDAVAAV